MSDGEDRTLGSPAITCPRCLEEARLEYDELDRENQCSSCGVPLEISADGEIEVIESWLEVDCPAGGHTIFGEVGSELATGSPARG